ncbi:glycosyltransferase family 2 protein [Mucilaginibacter sp. HD30]
MNKDITIAVVIPCFNSITTIQKCIESVFEQTDKVNEIIIVDDGSTDGSQLKIKELFTENKNDIVSILIEQGNSGPSVARNVGVNAAKSDYIAFLDSDDYWYANHITTHKTFLQSLNCPSYDIIATKYKSAKINYSGNVSFKMQLLKNYFLTPAVIVKKEKFQALGGFDKNMRFGEDYFLWLKFVHDSDGYLLPYIGSSNIENKKIFGEKGLSGNLINMHKGMIICYKSLFEERKLSKINYAMLRLLEEVKYLRRKLLS